MKASKSICLLGLVALSCLAQEKLPPSPVDEIGIYYQKGGHWIQMMPEVVNWQTGGVLKSVSTLGIVKGDVNGRLTRPASRTKFTASIQLLVHCPDGTAVTEYQLIRMHTHANAREFRTVTGGVLHVSGGAKRDTLEFESEHVAQRTYVIKLPDLPPGEYGLLSPGSSMANSAGAQLGKMYTFTIGENAEVASAAKERPMWKKVVF